MFLAENVFESNRLCYLFARFINFEFVTIKKSKVDGTVKGHTSKWDALKFIFGFSFGLFAFYDVLLTPLQIEKRSIIFEITMSINGKIEGFRPSLIMLHAFLFRNEYLNIFNTLDWIDKEVLKADFSLNFS